MSTSMARAVRQLASTGRMSTLAIPVLADAADQIDKLTAQRGELLKALTYLKHSGDNCWCGVAIGNPMMGGVHSVACKLAQAAIARVESLMAKSTRTYNSTVARIAGNILSAHQWYDLTPAERAGIVGDAVALARAVVAETQRTEPEKEVTHG